MSAINKAELVGRLTRDPTLHHTHKNKTSVITFAMANDYTYYDSNNNKHTHTDFPIVTIWGQQADTLYKYAGKGSLISVVGRTTTRSYTNKKGERVYVQEITVDKYGMELLATKPPHHNGNQSNDNQSSASDNSKSGASSDASQSSSASDNKSSGTSSALSNNDKASSSSDSSQVPDDKDWDNHANKIGINDDDLPF